MDIKSAKLVGGLPRDGRTELDYYATNPEAVRMLLAAHPFAGKKILEPCVGGGHIANVLIEYFGESVTGIDVVDRGYPETEIADFLKWEPPEEYDTIITNPPYSLAVEFIEKCIDCLRKGGQLATFMKIQFLEGVKRKEFFQKYPPKYLYVFTKRMTVFNNGREVDPKTGKPWVTTLCNAWYIWEKGSHTEPVIRWI